jgi:hypothetical protein
VCQSMITDTGMLVETRGDTYYGIVLCCGIDLLCPFFCATIWWEMIVDLSNGLHEQIVHIQTPGYYADNLHTDVSSDSYALKLKNH